MRVDENTLLHVAAMARLTLTAEEAERFLPQLNEIISLFSKLESADTQGVEPSFHPIPLRNRMREDEIEPCLSQQEALSNSSQTMDGYFKGPRAL